MSPHRLVLIDHRDSFTWNLAQAFQTLGAEVEVIRAAEARLERLREQVTGGCTPEVTHVVVGPGPGCPAGTAISRDSLELCRGQIPWLGVCLGHQVLAEAMGARVAATGSPVHGKRDWIHHDASGIFQGLPRPFLAARYHSLAVVESSVPASLQIVARAGDGAVMGCGIPGEATWGVQFHPESFMTPDGVSLLAAFLDGVRCAEDPEATCPVGSGSTATVSGDRGDRSRPESRPESRLEDPHGR